MYCYIVFDKDKIVYGSSKKYGIRHFIDGLIRNSYNVENISVYRTKYEKVVDITEDFFGD
jgi:hypothetical protein